MGEQKTDGRKTALTRRRDAAIEEVGAEEVYGWVETGLSARQIAEKLGLDADEDRAMWAVHNWLQSDPERYARAKERSVEGLADRALQVYGDEPPETTADGTWRDRKAGHLRWLAELRAGFSRDGVNVNIDLGQLHLDALRKRGSMAHNPDRVEPEPIDAEYEVEEEGNPRDKYTGKSLGTIPDER